MKKCLLVFILVIAGFQAALLAQGQDKKRCLTDELNLQIQQIYPDGVPGKTEMAPSEHDKADYDWTFVIPVVVHIMHDNGNELNVNTAQVMSQLDVLNEDFGRTGAGANTHPDGANSRIRFCLASIDPEGNPSTGINYVQYPGTANLDPFTQDTFMKKIIQWDPERYMNIWVVRRIASGTIQGYAYFPTEVAGTIWDGFVVEYKSFGRDAGQARTEGRTGSHEVGHWLNLAHPWGASENFCEFEDDDCDDTPKVSTTYFATFPSCIHPASCDPVTPRQIENYMDYSDDRCMNMFTNCQSQRMRDAILNYRYKLVSSENLISTGCFTALDTIVTTEKVYVYPNPAQDIVMIFVDEYEPGIAEVFLYDFYGKLIHKDLQAAEGKGAIPIDLSGQNMSVYLLVIRVNGKEYRHRIILGR